VFGVRGTLQVELTIHGANSDYHSGGKGGVVPNAASDLAQLLASMRDERGEVAIEGFYDQVRSPTPAELRAIDELPLDLAAFFEDVGISELPPPQGIGFYERLMLRPTLSVCGLASGYAGAGFKTAIPSVAYAKIDMRLVPDQEPDAMFDLFAAHVRRRAPNAEIHRHGAMRPSRTDIETPFAAAVIDAVTAADNVRPLVIPSHGGSLPDYVFTEILRVPSLIVPYANADERNHAPNENLEVERFYGGMRIFASVIHSLGRHAS
jgi:acetylornithine deacetylase/succinyl-diaminopimelate desuccinylase-like protein